MLPAPAIKSAGRWASMSSLRLRVRLRTIGSQVAGSGDSDGNESQELNAKCRRGAKLDVFALKQHLIGDYSRFARSFTSIRADDLNQGIEQEYASGRFWPEPLIQINPRYSLGRTTTDMAAAGELRPVTAKHFSIGLYRYQKQAVAFAGQGES